MNSISFKSEINETFTKVRKFSFEEKKAPLVSEDKVNFLLDAILEFKNELDQKTERIYKINERIENLTWYDDIDDDNLMLLNDLISSAKDLRTSLIRQYVSMNFLRKKEIALEEIRDFKNSIDELKESYEDLESVFFYLPKMQDFVENTNRLSLL